MSCGSRQLVSVVDFRTGNRWFSGGLKDVVVWRAAAAPVAVGLLAQIWEVQMSSCQLSFLSLRHIAGSEGGFGEITATLLWHCTEPYTTNLTPLATSNQVNVRTHAHIRGSNMQYVAPTWGGSFLTIASQADERLVGNIKRQKWESHFKHQFSIRKESKWK